MVYGHTVSTCHTCGKTELTGDCIDAFCSEKCRIEYPVKMFAFHHMNEKALVLMRGFPASGKSFTANQLKGATGVIYSTDEYWYKVNFPEKPDEYSFNQKFLHAAHKWNLLRAQKAIEESAPLIIIDNTNTTSKECYPYVSYAVPQGYNVYFQEPTSPAWMEIAPLLRKKKENKKALKSWAVKLEEINKATHSVPFWIIEKMMWRWEVDMTVEKVMESGE